MFGPSPGLRLCLPPRGGGRAHTFASLTCSQISPGRGGPRLSPTTPTLHTYQIVPLNSAPTWALNLPDSAPILWPQMLHSIASLSAPNGPVFAPIKSLLCSNCGRVGSMSGAGEGPMQRSWVCARDLSWGHWAQGQGQTSPTALAKTEEGCSSQIKRMQIPLPACHVQGIR